MESVELDLPKIPVHGELIVIDPARDPNKPSDLARISASDRRRRASRRFASGDWMSHLDIAPQPSVPAIEPLAQRSRAEIIDRYRKFRAISRTHNSGALKCMSSEAFMEQARRLGIVRGRTRARV